MNDKHCTTMPATLERLLLVGATALKFILISVSVGLWYQVMDKLVPDPCSEKSFKKVNCKKSSVHK